MVDNSHTQKTVAFLRQVGLEPLEVSVYMHLLQHGPNTVLNLSRGLDTGRTKLYPVLESLTKKQLATVHERHYGTSYQAQPPHMLESLVAEFEDKAASLRSALTPAMHMLAVIQQQSPTYSRITEYHGVDGLKQMRFNLAAATGEYVVLEHASLTKKMDSYFMQKLRQRHLESANTGRILSNNPRLPAKPIGNEAIAYLDSKTFTIQIETYVYNNCVSTIQDGPDGMYGVEIFGPILHAQMWQFFELLWSQAGQPRSNDNKH